MVPKEESKAMLTFVIPREKEGLLTVRIDILLAQRVFSLQS